jgi:hypothetical protein
MFQHTQMIQADQTIVMIAVHIDTLACIGMMNQCAWHILHGLIIRRRLMATVGYGYCIVLELKLRHDGLQFLQVNFFAGLADGIVGIENQHTSSFFNV